MRDSDVAHTMTRQQPPKHLLLNAAAIFINIVAFTVIRMRSRKQLIRSRRPLRPYHTSQLSGEGWVQELMNGHPDRIKNELGMRKHVFKSLTTILQTCGLKRSKHLSCEEQVAIFLYGSVTGLAVRHLGERFQHSNDTISRYVIFNILVEIY